MLRLPWIQYVVPKDGICSSSAFSGSEAVFVCVCVFTRARTTVEVWLVFRLLCEFACV